MMNSGSNPVRKQLSPVEKLRPGKDDSCRLRILATVDKSDCTDRVVEYLLLLRRLQARMEVVLLNIQPEPLTGRLRGYGSFKREVIRERLINELGRAVIARTRNKLDSAAIPHKDRIELGDAAETILKCARDEECNLIILAERTPGTIRRWLMRSAGISIGSTASIVHGFAQVPVVVVK